MSRLSKAEILITTVFGTGFSPIAPATVASAVTCLILWVFPVLTEWPFFLLIIPATLIGVWLSKRAIGAFSVTENHPFAKLRRPNPHKEDPDEVVFDEFVGQWITLIAATHTLFYYFLAFLFFRVFDIFKPLGIKSTQNAPGGWGVMIDDVLAGILGFLFIFILKNIFPGVFA